MPANTFSPDRLHGFSAAVPPGACVIQVVSDHLVHVGGIATARPRPEFAGSLARLLHPRTGPRFVLLHGALALFRRELETPVGVAAAKVRELRRRLVDAVSERLLRSCGTLLNPFEIPLDSIEFDVDGLDVNRDFMGSGADFRATQSAHFDIVEPIASNLYGRNHNVEGGLPVFIDARAYCASIGLPIRDMLTKAPGSRNLIAGPDHRRPLVHDFAVAIDVDMTDDTPFSIFVNRVEEAGLMHGATAVAKIDPAAPAARPISHYALDNVTDSAAEQWFSALGFEPGPGPGDATAPKPLLAPGEEVACAVLRAPRMLPECRCEDRAGPGAKR